MTIKHKRQFYNLTKSGKSFSTVPTTTDEEIITSQSYNNFVNSISFFNGFCCGTCRGYKTFTPFGYVVYKIVTISPARDLKYVDTFSFNI